MKASRNGKREMCAVLRNEGAIVDMQNRVDVTAFHWAPSICTLLLENNANLNHQMKNGASPLLIAVEKSHVNVCTLLLKNNTNVNQQDDCGVSPLYIAVQNGYVHVCTLT